MRSEAKKPINSGRFTAPSRANIADSAAGDILVRESWAQFCEVFDAQAHEAVTRFGMLMVKPDGLVSGTLSLIRRFLTKHGLEVVGAVRLSLNRNSIRLLWRRDWLDYSVDRLAFSDYLYTAGPAALLLIEDMIDSATPCSNRLACLKGPASPEDRCESDLRSVLGSSSRIINFVHTPDSCIEMLRELSVLLDREARRDFLQRRQSRKLEQFLTEIDREAGRHEFSLQKSLVRAGLQDSLGPVFAQERKLPFDEILRVVEKTAQHCLPWDFVTIALNAIELDWVFEPENVTAPFEIVCEAAGVRVPLEFENGARQAHVDLRELRAQIPAPGLHNEPAGMFRPYNTPETQD